DGARRQQAHGVFDEAAVKTQVRKPVHAAREAHVGGGHFDRVDLDRWMTRSQCQRDPSFARAGVEHTRRALRIDLPLEAFEFRIFSGAPDDFARLESEEDPKIALEMLERPAPLETPVVRL